MCCHPIYPGRQTCGCTSRGHTGGRLHRTSPASFCGAYLNFYREKDSAAPFPRRPRSRILSTHELIVLHLLGIIFFFVRKIPVRVTVPRFELASQRQKVSKLPTEPPGRPAKKGQARVSYVIPHRRISPARHCLTLFSGREVLPSRDLVVAYRISSKILN